jgi:hypothetical protein
VVERPTDAKTEGDALSAGGIEELKKLITPPFSEVSYPPDSLGRAKGPQGYVHGVKPPRGRRESMSRDLLKKGYYPQDDKGHLIADRFYGPASSENLVPMHQQLNNGRYKAYENTLADEYRKHYRAGRAVLLYMNVKPQYPADDREDFNSYRPARIIAQSVVYTLTAGAAQPTAEQEKFDDDFTNPPGEINELNINTPDLEELEAHLRALRVERKLRDAILAVRQTGRFASFDDLTRRLVAPYFRNVLPLDYRYNTGARVHYTARMKALLPPESKIRF